MTAIPLEEGVRVRSTASDHIGVVLPTGGAEDGLHPIPDRTWIRFDGISGAFACKNDVLKLDVARSAILSADEVYRYELRRTWHESRSRLAWIMLNPSTADADIDDPTIRRCVAFARAWGYGSIVVRNLFALRATDPRALRDHEDPVGPENERHLVDGVTEDDLVVCAWGAGGALLDRGPSLLKRYTECGAVLHHLGLTSGGHPRHPLYLRADTTPIAWTVPS